MYKVINQQKNELNMAYFKIIANKLALNASKTKIALFKSRNKKITKRLNFQVSGHKIKQSSQVQYLGVILQDDLHWDAHLTNLEKNSVVALVYCQKLDTMSQCTSCEQFIIQSLIPT